MSNQRRDAEIHGGEFDGLRLDALPDHIIGLVVITERDNQIGAHLAVNREKTHLRDPIDLALMDLALDRDWTA